MTRIALLTVAIVLGLATGPIRAQAVDGGPVAPACDQLDRA